MNFAGLLQPYGLISERHLARFLDRLTTVDLTRIVRTDSGNESAPWWKTQDIWGDPLPAPYKAGRVAVIPIKGMIATGLPTIFRAIGVTETEEIGAWIEDANSDPKIDRILLEIDSPGGIYTGTPELAGIVANIGKPVIAFTKGMMCSAAYWIASQADLLFCTPSADVGSIGVYMVHYDWTGALAQMGVAAEMFQSGDLKGAGHEDVSLTKPQRAQFQNEIDQIGAEFRSAVKSKRSAIATDSMRGQSFTGTEAANRNLVHGLRTFESLL